MQTMLGSTETDEVMQCCSLQELCHLSIQFAAGRSVFIINLLIMKKKTTTGTCYKKGKGNKDTFQT